MSHRLQIEELTPAQTSSIKLHYNYVTDSYVEKAKVFRASLDQKPAGYLQIGHETWNNRARIWIRTLNNCVGLLPNPNSCT